jgi:transposase
MFQERRRDFPGESALQSRIRVGELLDVSPATMRGWIERKEIDTGQRLGVSSDVSSELKDLRREVAELRRANEILRTASAFSRPRSSTADSSSRRLYRQVQGPLRGRADL